MEYELYPAVIKAIMETVVHESLLQLEGDTLFLYSHFTTNGDDHDWLYDVLHDKKYPVSKFYLNGILYTGYVSFEYNEFAGYFEMVHKLEPYNSVVLIPEKIYVRTEGLKRFMQ